MTSSAAQALRLRIGAGLAVLTDGSIAWAIEQQGFSLPPLIGPAAAIREAPDLIAAAHRAYVAAGVHVLRALTSHTTPRVLRRVGYDYRAAALTSHAVDLALEAAQDAPVPVAVAGVLEGVVGRGLEAHAPPESALRDEHGEQAERLRAAGCDVVLIQGLRTLREAIAATSAAAATGLPVFVSLACEPDGRLGGGEELGLVAPALRAAGAEVVGVDSCAIEDADRLANVLANLGGAWGVMPDFARPPQRRLLAFAARVRAKGAVLIGGGLGYGVDEAAAVCRTVAPDEPADALPA